MHEYWNSIELYVSLFGKDVKMDSNEVKNLKHELSLLPKLDNYDIIAYGSLMNERDADKTIKKPVDRFHCRLLGYERIFDVGWMEQGSFLNLRKTKSLNGIYCIGITVDYKELPFYIKREGLYDIVPVEYELINEEGLILDVDHFNGFTAVSNMTTYGLEPQLNYLHLCLTGINQELGEEGVEDFLKHTKCYSIKQHKYVTAEDWLSELDVIDYMIRHDYSPR